MGIVLRNRFQNLEMSNRARRSIAPNVNRRFFQSEADSRITVAEPVDGRPVTIAGYALVWGVLSVDRGGYKVRLLPNSAKFATPTLALWHHEWKDVLASTANGTLRVQSDPYGVRVEIDLANTNAGRDVAELVRRGDVRGMSFAMVDDPVATRKTENGETVLEAQSYLVDEVTVTAVPAFTQARLEPPRTPPAPVRVPVPVPGYAAVAQRYRFDLLDPDRYRLPGAELPRNAV